MKNNLDNGKNYDRAELAVTPIFTSTEVFLYSSTTKRF